MTRTIKLKFYIKIMFNEITRPAGTRFIQTINNEDVTVSRMKHMVYVHKATVMLFKTI